MNKSDKIYVAGHKGMAGSAIVRKLSNLGYSHIIGKSSRELDLRRQSEVELFFQEEKPDYVFMAAAKVGGIHANNTYRGDFLYENIQIQNNLIHSAKLSGVKKLLFLGSSCIYPKHCPQPILEEYLLTGTLEETNEPYAIAKIAGLKLCQAYKQQYGCDFFSVMPTNLYGPGDNYDLNNSHVLPALIKKFHEAKINLAPSVIIWGSGKPLREFLHVDDLAQACIFLMEQKENIDWINVGWGKDITIYDLALLIKEIIGYQGDIQLDASKPDGTPKKLLNTQKINDIGWFPKISLREGITQTYQQFLKEHAKVA